MLPAAETVLALIAGAAVAHAAGAGLPLRLAGPPTLVLDVERALETRASPAEARDERSAVHVQLYPDPAGIRLTLLDPDGRATERVVATAEIAAAVIDSWAHPDLTSPLLAPREPSVVSTEPAATAAILATPAAAPLEGLAARAMPVTPAHWMRRPALHVAADVAWASDRSRWMGVRSGLCFTIGPACVGAAGRFAAETDAGVGGPAPDRDRRPGVMDRATYDGLITAEVPIRIGRPVLLVGAGAGLGWLSTRGHSEDVAVGPRGGNEREGRAGRLGARLEARVGLALPLWSALALDVGIAGTATPGAHRDSFKDNHMKLPGEPLGQLSMALGLRWGEP